MTRARRAEVVLHVLWRARLIAEQDAGQQRRLRLRQYRGNRLLRAIFEAVQGGENRIAPIAREALDARPVDNQIHTLTGEIIPVVERGELGSSGCAFVRP